MSHTPASAATPPAPRRRSLVRVVALALLAPAAVATLAVAFWAAPSLAQSGAGAAPKVGTPAPKATAATPPAPGQAQTIEWEELIPEDERRNFTAGPPPATHDYLSGEGGLAAQQPMNYTVNGKLEGKAIRIPGFIVPLELDAQGKVTEFFLVPYFGACIHVPPPPPNQMLYVTVAKGIQLDSMYAAYWVTGKLSTKTKQTRLGAAAYSMSASNLEEYKY
jgi:hypothetical protein